MILNYDNLWRTIDLEVKKGALFKKTRISNVLTKMSRNESVSLSVILKICEILDCSIDDVMSVEKK